MYYLCILRIVLQAIPKSYWAAGPSPMLNLELQMYLYMMLQAISSSTAGGRTDAHGDPGAGDDLVHHRDHEADENRRNRWEMIKIQRFHFIPWEFMRMLFLSCILILTGFFIIVIFKGRYYIYKIIFNLACKKKL